MKKNIFLSILLLYFGLAANSQTSDSLKPVMPLSEITKDFQHWLIYQRMHISWTSDFIPLDTSGIRIPKEDFLYAVAMWGYLPVRMSKNDSVPCYQLFRLNENTDNSIAGDIKSSGYYQYCYYKMEGLPLPDYSFTDLSENVYNRENMTGKLLVIKCWFINCKSCIEEMPELNKKVAQYKPNDSVVFLGLAFDKKEELQKFLQKRKFQYNVVAEKSTYMQETLKIKGYPTHILVNRQGNIVKVSFNYKDIFDALDKELNK